MDPLEAFGHDSPYAEQLGPFRRPVAQRRAPARPPAPPPRGGGGGHVLEVGGVFAVGRFAPPGVAAPLGDRKPPPCLISGVHVAIGLAKRLRAYRRVDRLVDFLP